ncbi:MAG TPA: response regulator transcription factor [Polyangiaceae bacterium]|nr:response regulator transcription factor [Polyangiaceae bacterium]
MADVLVIDSDASALSALVPALREAGHAVRVTQTGAGGLLAARAHRPDVVVLEAALPDICGTEVCRSLKTDDVTRDTFVLCIGANATDGDRVRALELGADDYVAKPFSAREMVLRVRAMLRRVVSASQRRSIIGPLCIDRAAHRVLVHGRHVHLTVIELRLLCALCDGGARVQSREALLRGAWGAQRGVTVRTVDTHVKRLRKKLGDAAGCIRSVRGVGYGFDGPAGSAYGESLRLDRAG